MKDGEQTRRRWLTTCAGTAVGITTLSGCTGDSDDPSSATSDGKTGDDDSTGDGGGDGGDFGNWPMIHYDAANRLSVPHDGLDDEPDILWTAELEGTVSPPVVYDNTVYVSHGRGLYTAIDLEDGKPIWEHETSGRGTLAASETAIFVAGNGIEALDHDTGDVLWKTNHEQSVESLRIYDGAIYAGLEDRILALNKDGKELLEVETTETVQSLAIDENYVYVRSRLDSEAGATREVDFVMTALDRNSGDSHWELNLTKREWWYDDRFTRTFPISDDKIYTRNKHSLIKIDGSTGEITEIVRLNDSKPRVRSTIGGDIIYNREREPTAYNLENGKILQDWEPEESFDKPVVLAGGDAYTVRRTGISTPQKIMSIEPETGNLNWEIEAPELDDSHIPIVLNGLLIYPVDEPGIVAFG